MRKLYGDCVECGATVLYDTLNDECLCRKCAVRMQRNAKMRTQNLNICQGGTAKPNVQRIYDAFVAKYPDALLTGISVQDDGERLLLYLDNKPMYYAAIDPLTNAISLSSYAEAAAAKAAAEEARKADAAADAADAQCRRASKCAVITSILGIAYGLICFILQPVGGVIALVSSFSALGGGLCNSRAAMIFAGIIAFLAVVLGFPSSILFSVLAIIWLCMATDL